MRVLIAVASKHGSTREIADAIAEELRTENLLVDVNDAADVTNVFSYDAVILGSAVYAGSWLPEATSLAERNWSALTKVPVWFFSSGPLGAEKPKPEVEPEKLVPRLAQLKVRDHKIFVGKLDPADLGLAERLIAKAVRAPSGDFRDWDDIRGWARAIASEIALGAGELQ